MSANMVTIFLRKGGFAFLLPLLLLLQIFIILSPPSLFARVLAQPQELSNQDMDALVQDLRNSQFFTGASILNFLSPPFLTSRITIMIPTDAAIASAVSNFSAIALAYPTIIQFHIVERNLNFAQLELLPKGTWLPTMVPGKGIQITNDDPANFTLNDARIVKPDLCPSVGDALIACQGIDRLLDMSSMLVPEPQNPPFPPAPAPPSP